MDELIQKIKERSARVGIIGLGYVGLPLAVEFARVGFRVTGIDTDPDKVQKVLAGSSYVGDVSEVELRVAVRDGRLQATSDYAALEELDCVSICVPTPLRKTKDPDISYILAATAEIKRRLRPGQLIVLESTTFPGTTDEILRPELEQSGLKVGVDFSLAYSPERVDPGNRQYTTRNTPKIIGGITPSCTAAAFALYEQVIERVIPVSSTRAAEMVKLLENTFRAVNIALVNEIAMMCDRLEIDTWEVIDAAATKPFGFMPFYPGPGLGGHCIPVDPHYLSWKLKTLDYTARFIQLASEINAAMPHYVVDKVADALNAQEKSIKNAAILVLGIAYKRDVDDVRESPAIDIIKSLLAKGARVSYSDPLVPVLVTDDLALTSVELTEDLLASVDCVIIVTDHSAYPWNWIAERARLIVDTRNALRGYGPDNVIRL
ncbi:MAG: nucleotide sugar dehydrogenase [Deltaproteobacteria bacterium]|nr:nucleotide sugar dehydrogenase [Deltaproteobacteria bacterium]